MNAGLSKAQMPNGVNQLINTGLQLYGMGAFGGGVSPAAVAAPAVSAPASRGGYSYKPSQYGYNWGL